MTQALPKIDCTLLNMLVRGAQKTFENAEQLYFEAELLAKAGATARALCLHQISLEECSKIESIGAWAITLLTGMEFNQEKILASLRRHSSKNKTNAYMMEGPQPEKDAKASGDWKTMREEFKKFQAEFHEQSNDAKNAALYVDWRDGEFVSPSEQITSEMLARITERNRTFLGYAQNGLNMMVRLNDSPEDWQDLFVGFVEAAEKLRAEMPDDPITAGNTLVRNFLDAGVKRFTGKPD